METSKLRQALDEIIERCKAAGHRLHIFDPADIKYENVVGRGEEGIVQLCRVNYHGLEELSAIKVRRVVTMVVTEWMVSSWLCRIRAPLLSISHPSPPDYHLQWRQGNAGVPASRVGTGCLGKRRVSQCGPQSLRSCAHSCQSEHEVSFCTG